VSKRKAEPKDPRLCKHKVMKDMCAECDPPNTEETE
jgi:hypothetical protein